MLHVPHRHSTVISARTPSLYGRALGREGRGREPEAAADGVGERNEKRSLRRHQSGTLAHDIPDPARARARPVSCVAAVEVVRGAYAACAENLARCSEGFSRVYGHHDGSVCGTTHNCIETG